MELLKDIKNKSIADNTSYLKCLIILKKKYGQNFLIDKNILNKISKFNTFRKFKYIRNWTR